MEVAARRRRGEGSVLYDRTARVWIARVSLGVSGGKRVRHKAQAPTRKLAERELERLLLAYGAGGDPATETLDEYLAGWLVSHGRSVRPSTLTSYRGHVDNHISPLLGGIRVAKLRPADVRRLVDELERKGLSPATIRLVVTTLRIALARAVAERSIPDNPASSVRLPRVTREPVRPLTAAEADAIVDATIGTWLGPLVRLLLGSGLRLGEACGLDQRDLLLDSGFVRVRRSKTTIRAVPVSDDAVAALREALGIAPRRGPGEPVFFGPRANRAGHRDRLRGSSASHALPRILERSGLDHLAPHALRHGAATLMLADGVPMRVIAEQLGHANPALTARIYAHVIPEQQRRAVDSLERRRTR